MKADSIRTMFPKAKISFTPFLSTTPTSTVSFDEVNEALHQPESVVILSNSGKIVFKNKITNVKTLTCFCDLGHDLEHFQNVKNLEIVGKVDIQTHKRAIMNNGSSLERLTLKQLEKPWLFKLPWQMKELTCGFPGANASSTCYAEILSDQHNLRYFLLKATTLTNDLLDVLTKNKLLTQVQLDDCNLEESVDLSKFEFLNNVLELRIGGIKLLDFTFGSAIIDNLKKVNRLVLENNKNGGPEEMLDSAPATILENLQVLNVNEKYASKFISNRIKAPILEICELDCYSEFLLECKHLRKLTISGSEIDYDTAVKILETFDNLEFFYCALFREDLDKTLKYFLGNMKNIKHITLKFYARKCASNSTAYEIVESTLRASGIIWTKLIDLYQTESFSIAIY